MPEPASLAPVDGIPGFDFDPRTRVLFGAGSLSQLGNVVEQVGGSNVLLVTDSGLRQAGHEQRTIDLLEAAGLAVHVFDDVHPNPTTKDVEACRNFAAERSVDIIVGLGGGSSMDCAKGTNFLLTNGGRMQDYRGIGKAQHPMLPLIAIPTTAGTGSEAQSFAVIADADTHMKMACGDKKAAARVALLDPELTISMPSLVTAVTGIDAISHALESYVTKKRTAMSQLFSRRAWQFLHSGFPDVLADGSNLSARANMQLGAHFAGAAIENSMLGAAHALANPLSAHFDLIHGIAVGVMLPHVVRYNATVAGAWYGELAHDAGLCEANDPQAAALLADRLTELLVAAGQPTTLRACEVDASLFPTMAAEAAEQWTGQFNPRPVNPDTLLELYRWAYFGTDENS